MASDHDIRQFLFSLILRLLLDLDFIVHDAYDKKWENENYEMPKASNLTFWWSNRIQEVILSRSKLARLPNSGVSVVGRFDYFACTAPPLAFVNSLRVIEPAVFERVNLCNPHVSLYFRPLRPLQHMPDRGMIQIVAAKCQRSSHLPWEIIIRHVKRDLDDRGRTYRNEPGHTSAGGRGALPKILLLPKLPHGARQIGQTRPSRVRNDAVLILVPSATVPAFSSLSKHDSARCTRPTAVATTSSQTGVAVSDQAPWLIQGVLLTRTRFDFLHCSLACNRRWPTEPMKNIELEWPISATPSLPSPNRRLVLYEGNALKDPRPRWSDGKMEAAEPTLKATEIIKAMMKEKLLQGPGRWHNLWNSYIPTKA
ncbi:hypothetical protein RF11_03153 [Thelohanellus kitauei]|uniref:Uncharacterized protein n=1 Tax=Thelohanellus kitauei TaxID=669202 RepID=A0A0C2N617_THEKT|nr:hypothetical protein RF11_03153 [Thelohanellus kitauei]